MIGIDKVCHANFVSADTKFCLLGSNFISSSNVVFDICGYIPCTGSEIQIITFVNINLIQVNQSIFSTIYHVNLTPLFMTQQITYPTRWAPLEGRGLLLRVVVAVANGLIHCWISRLQRMNSTFANHSDDLKQ